MDFAFNDLFGKNKTSKIINKYIRNLKMPFSTIPKVESCIVTTKSEKEKN